MGHWAPSQLIELDCTNCCGTPLLGCIRRRVYSAPKWRLYKLLQSTGSHQGIVFKLKQSWSLHSFVSPLLMLKSYYDFWTAPLSERTALFDCTTALLNTWTISKCSSSLCFQMSTEETTWKLSSSLYLNDCMSWWICWNTWWRREKYFWYRV